MHYRFEKKNITDSKKHQHFPAQTPTQIRAAPFEKIKIKTHDRNAFQRGTRGTNTQIIRPSNEPTRQSIKLMFRCHISPPHDQLPLSNSGSHPTEHYPILRSLLFFVFFFSLPPPLSPQFRKFKYFQNLFIFIYRCRSCFATISIFQCFKVWSSKGRSSQLRAQRVTGVVLHCNQCILGSSCDCDQTAENGV